MSSPQGLSADFVDILRAERRDLLNRLRETRLSTLKEGYSQAQVVPYATYAPWLDDQAFQRLFNLVKGSTLVDVYRCFELFSLARQVTNVPGALVEVGVWRGGTAVLLGAGAPTKALHLFDTFSGVPKAEAEHDTLYNGGEHADASVTGVEALLAQAGLTAQAHTGIFPDDTRDHLPDVVALAHIDVDTYRSARECHEAIWPRLSVGGVLVFDDYGFFGCEGVTRAAQEIQAITIDGFFIHNLNGHAVFIKTA